MSFYNTLLRYKDTDFYNWFSFVNDHDVLMAIASGQETPERLLALLSPAAENHLEALAQKSHQNTLQYFGKAVLLYTPMYLANYCVNKCIYCGFNVDNSVKRIKLTLEEVEKESQVISSTGLRHILILTGESRKDTPMSYIKECVQVLKKYFTSISIEIFPLEENEYSELINEGVDGLTIYQEVYNEKLYDELHIAGPKKNYKYRLDAPERACKAGIRTVNIGSLLGLGDWRAEAFLMGLHAHYLTNKYPGTDFSISVPRLRPEKGGYQTDHPVSDRQMTHLIAALRTFLPRLGVTLSTRETAELRDNLLPIGITKMSAGSTTAVGGHSLDNTQHGGDVQFEISDQRDVMEMKKMLLSKGYQPVLKDWMPI